MREAVADPRVLIGFTSETGPRRLNEDFVGAVVGGAIASGAYGYNGAPYYYGYPYQPYGYDYPYSYSYSPAYYGCTTYCGYHPYNYW